MNAEQVRDALKRPRRTPTPRVTPLQPWEIQHASLKEGDRVTPESAPELYAVLWDAMEHGTAIYVDGVKQEVSR